MGSWLQADGNVRQIDGPHIETRRYREGREDVLEVRVADPIHYEAPRQSGPIPRTMADVQRENSELRAMLKTAWQTLQSQGAYLIQQGQGLERYAVSLANELESLSKPLA